MIQAVSHVQFRQESISEILADAQAFFKDRNVRAASYRIVGAFQSQLSRHAVLLHYGFPKKWAEIYDNCYEFRRHDPIANFVMSEGRIMTWEEAIDSQTLSVEQEHFVSEMRKCGLMHGMAVPLYGPGARESYASFTFGKPITGELEQTAQSLVLYYVQLHNAISNLLSKRSMQKSGLSQREVDVLKWMARGKSNTDIATILNISPATVATYVRRLFLKLDVHDRRGAVVKAIGNGWLGFIDGKI